MAEPTVQVPVSLIEALAQRADWDGSHVVAKGLRDALLSQPTPTAEPSRVVITRDQIENGVREVIEDGEWSDADDLPPLIVNAILSRSRYLPTAEPPRIEGMAPRTSGRTPPDTGYWPVIDPSTIRDVTPPRGQQ